MIPVVAIGASAGGFDALLQLISGLPADFPAAVLVVLHLPPDSRSVLAETFGARASIVVREPEDKEPLRPGVVYIAPAGYHLLLERDDSFSLSVEPPVHFSRPSIDVLFESVAVARGKNCAGIILTGANQDGAAGLKAIMDRGGLCIVQDPATAAYPIMPQSAIESAGSPRVLSLPKISEWLDQAARARSHPFFQQRSTSSEAG